MAQRSHHSRGGRPQIAALSADPRIARAFAVTWQHEPGQAALGWLLRELDRPIYSVGQTSELAIAQCVRIEVAELIRDLVRAGRTQLEKEAAAAAGPPAAAETQEG